MTTASRLDAVQFIEARHFTRVVQRRIDLLVIHDMEAPEDHDRAESCARYFATTEREASAHYCIDDDSVVKCVLDENVAWAAPGGNSDGLQFELAGYAAQDRAGWNDPYSKRMLDLAAHLFAAKCEAYEIPAVLLEPADLRDNMRGITTHARISDAFGLSSHTDPGPSFPLGQFVQRVRDLDDHKTRRPRKPELPTLEYPEFGWQVKKAAKLLEARGFLTGEPAIKFDESMRTDVKRFQRARGLHVDGIIGPDTWRQLRRP